MKEQIYQSVLDLIGNTPMVYLNRLTQEFSTKVMAKLEMMNPASSVKDRIALAMIEDAEYHGIITAGKNTIIEATSGNTGIGLSLVAAIKGYSCIIVLPESMSTERRQIIKSFGAKIVLTPADKGFLGAIDKVHELLQETPNSWSPMQFCNPSNPIVHYKKTGQEIWQSTGGNIDVFVCGVGTGGTITGVAKYLKSKKPDIHIVAVEPTASPLLSGGNPGIHKIQGFNGGFIADTTDKTVIDEVITVDEEQAFSTSRDLAQKEGIFAGMSSGASTWAALKVAKRMENKNIAVLLPDTGERYLSTALWNPFCQA